MNLSERALRRLFPQNSHAFQLPGGAGNTIGMLGQIINALSLSFERLRVFLKQILTEAVPFYAVLTLPAWMQALGLVYDSTQGLAYNQATADAAWAATGGQSLSYLNVQIQRQLPNVYIQENLNAYNPVAGFPATDLDGRMNVGHVGVMRMNATDASMTYLVLGTVTTQTQYNLLLSILARIAPVYLYANIEVIILNNQFLARVGLAQMNNARVGKGS